MLTAFVPTATALRKVENLDGTALTPETVWIDLVRPTPGEDKLIEKLIGVEIPTREEMQEIEISSRLYIDHGARYMTATLMCQSDTSAPRSTSVTFILANHRLVTVRYDDPKPFAIVDH